MVSSLDRLNHTEIRAAIAANPVLVLPLSALEPIGTAALGTVSAAACAVAEALALRMGALCSPVFNHGFAVPFKAFGGACGLHAPTLESALCGIAADAALWGVRELIIVDGSSFSAQMVTKAEKRINGLLKGKIKARGLSWMHEKTVRAAIAAIADGDDTIRPEAALVAIASFAAPELIAPGTEYPDASAGAVDASTVRSWTKRGRDPEQFLKLFPNCRTGVLPLKADAEKGRLLVDGIADALLALVKNPPKQKGGRK